MDFSLTEEQRSFRETIISFARAELNRGAIERDRKQTFPRDLWMKCGEMGLQGLPVSEEYQGRGLDAISTCLALEALGYGCRDGGLTFAICAHLLSCVVPVWRFGTEEQKEKYLPGLCRGTSIAVAGMTERDSGSDAFSMTTTAVRDGDGFRLNGRKTFGSNAPVSDLAIVYAATDPEKGSHGGVTAFLVEKGMEGFRTSRPFDKMGLRTCAMGELVLEDVRLPPGSVLGEVGAGAAVFFHSMEWERACLGASHVGTMERLLERSIEYARARKSSGKSIGKFQAISHQIADMKVRLEASRLLTYRAAWELDRTREVALDSSIAKLFVSESLKQTSLASVQILGGYGFLTEYEVERTLRDSIGGSIYSGTSEIQRNLIARWLGL